MGKNDQVSETHIKGGRPYETTSDGRGITNGNGGDDEHFVFLPSNEK